MRISTYKKKMDVALKHRPHFESENIKAVVILTGENNDPVIDVGLGDQVFSIECGEAKLLASWIKQVTR